MLVDEWDSPELPMAVAELLVRSWLYKSAPDTVLGAIERGAAKTLMEPMVEDFRRHFIPLRLIPHADRETGLNQALSGMDVGSDHDPALNYLVRRLRAFLKCDGIIPVTLPDNPCAVPIPFRLRRKEGNGRFLDWELNEIDGWIDSAEELWLALKRRYCIQLGCTFGQCAGFHQSSKLFKGDSFALPILLGASRSPGASLDPLQILCTGRVVDGSLLVVGGVPAKSELARRIGVDRLYAPEDSESSPLPNGSPVKDAIQVLWQRLGCSRSEAERNVENVFPPKIELPFSDLIIELTSDFVGRDSKIEDVMKLIGTDQEGAVENGDNHQASLLLYGPAGCGKSAFMASIARTLAFKESGIVVPHFFGQSTERTMGDFFKSAVRILSDELEIDIEQVKRQPLHEQFLFVAEEARAIGGPNVSILLDGVEELDDDELGDLIAAYTGSNWFTWVFSAQEGIPTCTKMMTIATTPMRLGGLKTGGMRQLFARLAQDMPEALRAKIISRAGGLPLFARLIIKDWHQGVFDPDAIPNGLADYYKKKVERMSSGTERWRRESLVRVLSLLASTHRASPVSRDCLTAALEAMGIRRTPGDDVESVLDEAAPLLREVRDRLDPNSEPVWEFRHDSFRRFLFDDEDFRVDVDEAREVWIAFCKRCRDPQLPRAAREYGLRWVIYQIIKDGEDAEVFEFAVDAGFLEAQASLIPPGVHLDTLKRAIRLSLCHDDLARSAKLVLSRANEFEVAYSGSPFHAMKDRANSSAIAQIEHIEDQDHRTLWLLALAAWHALGNRYWLAAHVLDHILPISNLRDSLDRGASMCAAALLYIIRPVETRRFEWVRYLARLHDDAKRRLLAVAAVRHPEDYRVLVQAAPLVRDGDVRNQLMHDIIRGIAPRFPKVAESLLWKIQTDLQRASAAINVAELLYERGDLRWANKVVRSHIPANPTRQYLHIKLVHSLALRRIGNIGQADEMLQKILEHLEGDEMDLREKVLAYGDIARIAGNNRSHGRAYLWFEIAQELAERIAGEPIFRATAMVDLSINIAGAVGNAPKCSKQLSAVVARALHELEQCHSAKADDERVRLLRSLARAARVDEVRRVLDSIKGEEARAEAYGAIRAYSFRNGNDSAWGIREYFTAWDLQMQHGGMSALEKISQDQSWMTFNEVSRSLPFVRPKAEHHVWGAARILASAASVLHHHGDDRALELLSYALKRVRKIKDFRRGHYLLNVAAKVIEIGEAGFAGAVLDEARACMPRGVPAQAGLRCEIEGHERKLRHHTDEGDLNRSVVDEVVGMKDDSEALPLKIECLVKLVKPLAVFERWDELTLVCGLATELVDSDAAKVCVKLQDRERLAAELAAKRARYALGRDGEIAEVVKLLERCERLRDERGRVDPHPEAVRAKALLLDRTSGIEDALKMARMIANSEVRCNVLRDLAIRSVEEDESHRVSGLLKELTFGRSQHIPDIARAIATRRREHDTECLRDLLLECSEYPDAAYRGIMSMIEFHRPDPETLTGILTAIGIDDFEEQSHHKL
jgi:hypothetical protein